MFQSTYSSFSTLYDVPLFIFKNSEKLLGMLRIEPRSAGWEARLLHLCYAPPPSFTREEKVGKLKNAPPNIFLWLMPVWLKLINSRLAHLTRGWLHLIDQVLHVMPLRLQNRFFFLHNGDGFPQTVHWKMEQVKSFMQLFQSSNYALSDVNLMWDGITNPR